jgi:dipeptidase D
MDIHLGRGNANKLMNRVLFDSIQRHSLQIAFIDGGGLRNAIPRESFAVVVVPERNEKSFLQFIENETETLKNEYQTTDPDIALVCQPTAMPGKVMSRSFSKKLVKAIYACPNGIYRMSPDIEDLVQTSNNIARIVAKEGHYSVLCLTRSSVNSEKMDLAHAIQCALELAGAKVKHTGGYPGWAPKPDAAIVQLMSRLYEEMYHEKPLVNACHAGLECGILGQNYPGMEMISFGPNIRGAHSPDEMVQISSVQKFWHFLLETLKRTPEKQG